ncbi:MAG: hypothetical protein M1836_005371 [Candelina mexicana]|nr:MAG: hypothetical protein M1836_005371 [Candelina mexicana]
MEQTKAQNALDPFVLLSKSATSPRAAADLITQATSAPNTYVFAELLQTPNIQSLREAPAEYSPYLTLLEIFAWGTWADYTSTPGLPQLSDQQSHKLRQLTLLQLSQNPNSLTYSNLLKALSLPTVRALEDLVISAIYAGLLFAKLDTLASRVDVSSVSPLRDLRPNSVPQMIKVLDDWDSRCVGVLGDLEVQMKEIRRRAAERRKKDRQMENILERAMNGDKGGKRAAAEEGFMHTDASDEMEIDDVLGRGGVRNAKRGGARFNGGGRR